MDKLKNIDHGVYPIEDINYISYICTDVKKKTYKIDKTIPKHIDRL